MNIQEAMNRIEQDGDEMRIERTERGRWFGSVRRGGHTEVIATGATMGEAIIILAESLERKALNVEGQIATVDSFLHIRK